MFNRNKAVEETLLEKAIREARESGAWDAANSLMDIQRQENQRRSQEWRNGFFKGYSSAIVGVSAGVAITNAMNKKRA